jgi:hypothetical protein
MRSEPAYPKQVSLRAAGKARTIGILGWILTPNCSLLIVNPLTPPPHYLRANQTTLTADMGIFIRKVWFNTPPLCGGSNKATPTKIWY